ncbi:hypothetical protein D3C80_1315340 [compost metagenome]
MAVPVDPKDADRAVVEGELGQPQVLLGGAPRFEIAPRRQQPALQPTPLAALPGAKG